MQRLALLMPRPGLHLNRVHVVPAPNSTLRALVVPQDSKRLNKATPSVECETSGAHLRLVRLSRAKLLKRVFDRDPEHCTICCGELKINAAYLEQPVFEKMLDHLGLLARAHPRMPARGYALQAA